MKIITKIVIVQLLFLATGSYASGESKRVGCWYHALKSEKYEPTQPEEIETSLCSYLVYTKGDICADTGEIRVWIDDYIQSLAKLKVKTPDLKLFLHVATHPRILESSYRENIFNKVVEWLKENGFDGLNLSLSWITPDTDVSDFYCDLRTELDKHGLILSTVLIDDLLRPGLSQEEKETIRKVVRCSEHLTLTIHPNTNVTARISSLRKTKAAVDKLIGMGLNPEKIQITISGLGLIYSLQDNNSTGYGVNVTGPGDDTSQLAGGYLIGGKGLVRKLNDTSLGWTIHRDNETMEPYAFTNTGIWTSYEDTTSAELKALYVLEKGLGGVDTIAMDLEDVEGIGGEGSFPLTRTIHNTFLRGYQSPATSH